MVQDRQSYFKLHKKGLDSICSDPANTSFILHQNEEENSEEEAKQEKERANGSDTKGFNDEDLEQEVPPDKTPLKKRLLPNRTKNEMSPRSQLQALPQLAVGDSKGAEVNVEQMKLEQGDLLEALPKFQR